MNLTVEIVILSLTLSITCDRGVRLKPLVKLYFMKRCFSES